VGEDNGDDDDDDEWNDTDRGEPKYWKKYLYHSDTDHHRSHMDWPGIERGLQQSEAVTHSDKPQLYSYLNIQLVPRSKHSPSRL